MSETLLALIPTHGVWLLFAVTFAGAMGLPVPTGLLILAAGALTASGDLALGMVLAAALAGAVLGDHTSFAIGRHMGPRLTARLGKVSQSRVARASDLLARHGTHGIFLSRNILSPIGPVLNYVAGAARLTPWRFSLASITGEAVWVAAYAALGIAFADSIAWVATLAGNALGFLTAFTLTAITGIWLWTSTRAAADAGPAGGRERPAGS